MIEVKSLYKKFRKLPVLRGIDLILQPGRITAILGPNGSGKTTLLKCILGMVIPDAGDICLGGKSILGQHAYRHELDYLPQVARFPENLRVSELIHMIKDLREVDADEAPLVELFQIEPFLRKKIRVLSGGMKQKVNLLLSLMFDSPILILDEPTAGLDPVALTRLKRLLKERKAAGTTIVFTSHIMSLVDELADDVIFLLEGKVWFSGTVEELRNKYQATHIEQAIAAILETNESRKSGTLKIVKGS